MGKSRSDALIFLDGTSDLAYKRILPALHARAQRGRRTAPVVGLAALSDTIQPI
jgi:hypothetical protein